MLKNLTNEQEIELVTWIEAFELSRPSKRLGRDFSDGVLLAEILKSLFPKLVDLHNYPVCNSVQHKINNWDTLGKKVLRKINVLLNDATKLKLAEANTETVKLVLYETMHKSQKALDNKYNSAKNSITDISESSEIMTINIEKQIGDRTEVTSQKMIFYDLYQKLEQALFEETQVNKILKQKNEHLENLLKLKNDRIMDLEIQLKRKEKSILQNIPFDIRCKDELE